MNYGEILEKAARILWRFKILWIFGLFSSCAGSGAGVGSNFRYSVSSAEISNLPAPLRGPLAGIVAFIQSISPFGWFMVLVLFLVTLGIGYGFVRSLPPEGQQPASVLASVGWGVAFILTNDGTHIDPSR